MENETWVAAKTLHLQDKLQSMGFDLCEDIPEGEPRLVIATFAEFNQVFVAESLGEVVAWIEGYERATNLFASSIEEIKKRRLH
jgi:hypothetical protein